MRASWAAALAALALGCGEASPPAPADGGSDAGSPWKTWDPERFATRVVSFTPGENAGFGQDKMPGVVLGPPHGKGDGAGSLDVVSLGKNGEIVLGFDLPIVDGPGPDLIVFENPFLGFIETGLVAVSEDGETFTEFPCAADDKADGYPGCAGVHPVYADAGANDVDPTDPKTAGGDAFDLAAIGVKRARFVRIRDSGENQYLGTSGGFDLDAVSIVNAGTPDGS